MKKQLLYIAMTLLTLQSAAQVYIKGKQIEPNPTFSLGLVLKTNTTTATFGQVGGSVGPAMALWLSGSTTPTNTNTNYSLAGDQFDVLLNGGASVQLRIGNTNVCNTNSTGVQVTGQMTTSDKVTINTPGGVSTFSMVGNNGSLAVETAADTYFSTTSLVNGDLIYRPKGNELFRLNDANKRATFSGSVIATSFSASATSTLTGLLAAGQMTLNDAINIALNTTTGTKIGTATTQKIGFFNATPVVQQTATTDLGTVLSNLGLRVSGTAYPITTSGAVSMTGVTTLSNFKCGYVAKTTAYTVTTADYLIDCTSGTFTVTLPAAATAGAGKMYIVFNSGAGAITVAGNGAELINAANTYALATTNKGVGLYCTGTKWLVIFFV